MLWGCINSCFEAKIPFSKKILLRVRINESKHGLKTEHQIR